MKLGLLSTVLVLALLVFTISDAYASIVDITPVRVSTGNDDAEESSSGSFDRTSSDLELVLDSNNQQIGMRFNVIAIPDGATIVSAYIQFTADETHNGATSLTIFGHDDDNSLVWTSSTKMSKRLATTASVAWNNIPAWNSVGEAGANQKTPNLQLIVQEIVDRPGWTSGNSISFIVNGTGKRVAESADGSSSGTLAPLLSIQYNTESSVPGVATGLTPTISNTQVSLTWNAAPANGQAISNYIIEYSSNGGTSWTTFADGTNTNTTVAVTSLTNNQEYQFRVSAINNSGTGSASSAVTVTPNPLTTITPVRISASSDDAEQSAVGTSTNINDSDLDFGYKDFSGLRFNQILIPSGATITNATIQFKSYTYRDDATGGYTIVGKDIDNSPTFTTATNNISSRTQTSASVAWSNIPTWGSGELSDDTKTS